MTEASAKNPHPANPRRRKPLFRVVRQAEHFARRVLVALERRDVAMLRPWLKLARSREFWRFVRFLATGGVNFAFSYSVFIAVLLLGGAPTSAVVVSWVLGVLFNFATTGRVVFGTGRVQLLPRFIGVYLVQLAANIVLLRALIGLGVAAAVAQALVIGALAIATFFALRRFVFGGAAPAR